MLSDEEQQRNARSLSTKAAVVVRGDVADPRARPTVRPQRLALGVLARAPQFYLGANQNNFAPLLTQEATAELFRALLTDTLNSLAILPMGHRAVLALSEEESEPLRDIVPTRWHVVPTSSENVAAQINAGLSHLFSTGAEGALVLTSNAPLLPLDEIFEGMLWLTKGRRILLGPTERGALYAIGTTRPEPALFEGIDIYAKDAFEQVKARAAAAGLETQAIKAVYTLDEPADVERFARDLSGASGPAASAPTCAAHLARAGVQPK